MAVELGELLILEELAALARQESVEGVPADVVKPKVVRLRVLRRLPWRAACIFSPCPFAVYALLGRGLSPWKRAERWGRQAPPPSICA
jgi:hypothetical protein